MKINENIAKSMVGIKFEYGECTVSSCDCFGLFLLIAKEHLHFIDIYNNIYPIFKKYFFNQNECFAKIHTILMPYKEDGTNLELPTETPTKKTMENSIETPTKKTMENSIETPTDRLVDRLIDRLIVIKIRNRIHCGISLIYNGVPCVLHATEKRGVVLTHLRSFLLLGQVVLRYNIKL